jgi:hypothetical protein
MTRFPAFNHVRKMALHAGLYRPVTTPGMRREGRSPDLRIIAVLIPGFVRPPKATTILDDDVLRTIAGSMNCCVFLSFPELFETK